MLNKCIKTMRRSLPAACIVCALEADKDYCICSHCEASLARPKNRCRRCGLELVGTSLEDTCCNRCQRSPPSFTSLLAAYPYITPINSLVTQFKFSARFDIGYALSRVLASAVDTHYREADKPQLLLPVPLHPQRLNSRGFNQAEEVCKVLSDCCQIATSDTVLHKTRNTQAQTAMRTAKARKKNLRAAFALRNLHRLRNVTHIALVDDVVTTMATVEAIAKLLQAQHSCRIDVWCLARASR